MTVLSVFPDDRFLIISAPPFPVAGVQIVGPVQLNGASWKERPIGIVRGDCILFDAGRYLAPDSLEIALIPEESPFPQPIKFLWLHPEETVRRSKFSRFMSKVRAVLNSLKRPYST